MEEIDKGLRATEVKARESFLNRNIKPDHYHKGGIDVIGFMQTKVAPEEMRGFFRGNILKYITRYTDKNGVEDLEKARYYLDRLIELEGK